MFEENGPLHHERAPESAGGKIRDLLVNLSTQLLIMSQHLQKTKQKGFKTET